MRAYQAFELDEVGHVSGCIDLFCEGDDDAGSQAQQIGNERDIELWRFPNAEECDIGEISKIRNAEKCDRGIPRLARVANARAGSKRTSDYVSKTSTTTATIAR
jgi:hypothetical protein